MKKELLAAIIAGAGIVMSMFATGCSDGVGGGDKDTVYIGTRDTIYLGGGGSGKQLFPIHIRRNTTSGTYVFEYFRDDCVLYPFPKFIVNEVEVVDVYYDENDINVEMDGIHAGDLTYSIIWDGDTLTRTVNLPNNTYMLAESHTETHYRYSVAGGNGDEKVIWQYSYREYMSETDYDYIYKRDTLSVSNPLIFPKTFNLSYFYCYVMHKDTKPLGPGYTATAESKKIAVVEDIQLWRFRIIGSW